jgi:5-methyltetrahydropteroyltriglutamate--homocysteine methyltransferase
MLATHIGSLPRPQDLLDLMQAREEGKEFDQAAFDARVREAVADVVRRQAGIGLDVVNDGEQGKLGFITYANERLSGFEPRPERSGRPHFGGSREHQTFPDFYEQAPGAGAGPTFGFDHLVCTGPVSYVGHAQLQKDIDNLKAALASVDVEEAFLPAVSPSNFEEWHKNRYYDTEEEYLFAIADALHEEYWAIVDAGFLLQVDDPNLSRTTTPTPARRSRSAAGGRSHGWTRSTTRCATSPRTGSGSTRATGSTSAPACTTWS